MLPRTITLALLFLLLASRASLAQYSLTPNLTLEEHQNLKGPVRQVKTTAESPRIGPWPKTVTFHRNGNVQSTYEVPPGGSEYHSYTYNEREQLLKMEIKMATNGHTVYVVNEYGPEGKLLLTREWNRSGTLNIDTILSRMIYDERGRFQGYTMTRVSPSGNSRQMASATYTLDTLRTTSGADTALRARMALTLGKNIIHFDTLYTPNGELRTIATPMPIAIFSGSSMQITTLYQNARPVRKEYRNDTGTLSVTAIEYNDSGMVERIRPLPFPDGTPLNPEVAQHGYHFEYEYDAHGNWIRRTCSTTGEATLPCRYDEETRVIEYYE